MTEVIWVDVFATTPLSGNQLAVIPDARGLSDEQMQAIARETALSETTFVLPADDGVSDLRFRIFTPAQELPMAGHPVVGTAWVMSRSGAIGSEAAVQTGVGSLSVATSEIGGEMVQAPAEKIGDADLAAVADSLGAALDRDADGGIWSTGLPQLMLPLQTLTDLERAAPNGTELAALGEDQGWIGVSAYVARQGERGMEAVVRHFAPGAGVLEDPATGSAAGALGACLAAGAGGDVNLAISQGANLGRPAEIRVGVVGGTRVTVGGRVRPVMTATLDRDALS